MNISTAKRAKKAKFHIPSTVITTLETGSLVPVNCVLANAGDSFDVKYNQFTRLSPLLVPTFGSFKLKTMSFFVPFSSIWKHYNDWRASSIDASISYDLTPKAFTLKLLLEELFNTADFTSVSSIRNSPYVSSVTESVGIAMVKGVVRDFHVVIAQDSIIDDIINGRFAESSPASDTRQLEITLNARGRWLINIIRGLGYEIPTYLLARFGGSLISQYSGTSYTYSIYPLLAFARCLYDYIYPSRYLQQQGFAFLFSDLFDPSIDSDVQIYTALKKIMQLLFVGYEQDFFTSLWTEPNQSSPNSGLSNLSIPGASTPNGGNYNIDSNQLYTSYTRPSGQFTSITGYGLRLLQSTSDYVIRNNIGGSRFVEWMKSHFGFATDAMRKDMSDFIKMWSDDIQIGSVENTTASSEANLGAMAGRGHGFGNGSVKYTCKEDGFLIFMSMVVPRVGYYQGQKPFTHALGDSRSLYVPEFDSVGMEAIPRRDLFSSHNTLNSFKVFPLERQNNVLGFAPRYANLYKRSSDYLLGDFRFNSRNVGLSSYHTMRDVLYGRSTLFSLDAQFLSVDQQYDRIFQEYNPDGSVEYDLTDKMFTIMYFDITRHANMLTIGESMPLFNKQGESVSLDYLGHEV